MTRFSIYRTKSKANNNKLISVQAQTNYKMISLYLAIVLGYGALLILLMFYMFSNTKFASLFKKSLLSISKSQPHEEGKREEVFSILHGNFK